ncbi:MAG TPA: isoprenylcysteine carboxylmethyltransferase family protein [Ramlibacter sp.]|uniref:methyltransferase family protein n=1 Tax=Ramlibacter sp. TaxID=1917967 RepID=UPI002CE9F1F8|nr:isoprenylcysteine carboxylmethyltransferase family protein [Ramlibacter sp.]HVZ46364.1 isoprenylcysteine carboxylmethyltransferase family protein [Ramlibacter sp.]
MGSPLVALGDFSFKYRGYLLPIAVILLVLPSPRLFADPAVAGTIGFVLAVIGQAVRVGTIGLDYIIRGGKDHKVYAENLVTGGLYSHCRNPMYVGNFFLLLGLAMASNSWVFALVGIPLSLGMHKAIVAAEENFLRNKFGAEFEAYCARVNRWVPRLSGLGQTLRGMQFDWRRVVMKEYRAGFDWFSATALVILIRLGQASLLDDNQILTAVMVLVIAARFVLWFASRQMNKRTPPATAGA